MRYVWLRMPERTLYRRFVDPSQSSGSACAPLLSLHAILAYNSSLHPPNSPILSPPSNGTAPTSLTTTSIQQSSHQPPHSNHPSGPQPGPSGGGGGMSFLFDKVHDAVHGLGSDLSSKFGTGKDEERHSHTHAVNECSDGTHTHTEHRYWSFAPERPGGNDVKWYVDACGYMWAVSRAIEEARHEIWILDWWLSPELYLRRPPAKNEQYRIDRMLQAAAERGVKIKIIVYKEVTQALTRKLLNPVLPRYLDSLFPRSTDPVTRTLSRLGLHAIFTSLEEVEKTDPLIAPPLTVSSSHTKHALEDLHPNIAVLRHPDHLPDRQTIQEDLLGSLQNLTLNAATASKLPGNALSALYGATDDTVLYWAHHEKLCLIDGRVGFMGGLDLCYGRWDTNQHPIADAHPGDMDRIVFPGQDYNNARVMDFQDVVHWQNNKLDRTKSSRMGWSDVSLCIMGPLTHDLQAHFAQRWNFIYEEKYRVREDKRYAPIEHRHDTSSSSSSHYQRQQGYGGGGYRGMPEEEGAYEGERGGFDEGNERGLFGRQGGLRDKLKQGLGEGVQRLGERYGSHGGYGHAGRPTSPGPQAAGQHYGPRPGEGVAIQLTRSCAKWSHGGAIEHSIANAYIEAIRNARHFVYIENQFFITATCEKQKPIKNMIGAAMVERVLRAHRNGERFKIVVVIPAVPAFPGDLKSDDALSTRAIMEFQYNSINRGGYSIYESLAREGVNPMDYIRFYNLRNYDRINASGAMADAERKAGVSYEQAREGHDERFGGVYEERKTDRPREAYELDAGYSDPPPYAQGQQYGQHGQHYGQQGQYGQQQYGQQQYGGQAEDAYNKYQHAAHGIGRMEGLGDGRWDTVSECYMLGGTDIRRVPWAGGGAVDEIDAFVSEELYVHSKLLIADDRLVICGSANLNDRSQLGYHDSEIAVVIEDPTAVESRMGGRAWRASKFAAGLRRQIWRKHLGLLRPQDMGAPDDNFEPLAAAGNRYDWGSEEDVAVADPIADETQNLWNARARSNTLAFGRVFHCVPSDEVRNWGQYDEYYGRFFCGGEKEEKGEGEGGGEGEGENKKKTPAKYGVGHVVKEEFPGGVEEVKEVLSRVRGTLVEMPLLFLKEEDIAKEGLGLNAFTEEVYT
ncbi:hypothetical protein BDY21DRAFT_412544 [Lineolata rhizophorae]|uniref:phospholipase D n=1 Tax=Lineolata rhizophorae TaxID=578093 RepID=A0A6A6PE73_9PEZI|nr:hypothetical protein BDY21DRAFT_412544 [Lineolata rhizophorae]